MSHQLGKNTSVDDIKGALEKESDFFKDSLDRMIAHLKANEVDVDQGAALTLGADLKFDVTTEAVTNHDKANQMMSREFRKGFEVPNMKMKAAS